MLVCLLTRVASRPYFLHIELLGTAISNLYLSGTPITEKKKRKNEFEHAPLIWIYLFVNYNHVLL